MKRFLSLFTAAVLLLGCASAEVLLEERGVDLPGGSVHYPAVTGMADETLQQEVNRLITSGAEIETLVSRVALLTSAPTKLYADCSAMLRGDVVSAAFDISGALYTARKVHEWRAVNVDLRTGTEITLADLFPDEDGAKAFIEEYLQYDVAPELSAHLSAREITPLPDCFTVNEAGITFYYSADRLCTLSDRAGSVQICWYELADWLDRSENGIPARIGALDSLSPQSRETLAAALSGGSIPGIPVKLGDAMTEVIAAYRMLTDEDLIEGSRIYALEAAPFRSVWVMTDALSDTLDHSVVNAIRTDRMNLCGLVTGVTRRDTWLRTLGDPDSSVTLDADTAESRRLEAGISDYYVLDGMRLRLHSVDGVLTSIILTW